jgi:hypothetical protein
MHISKALHCSPQNRAADCSRRLAATPRLLMASRFECGTPLPYWPRAAVRAQPHQQQQHQQRQAHQDQPARQEQGQQRNRWRLQHRWRQCGCSPPSSRRRGPSRRSRCQTRHGRSCTSRWGCPAAACSSCAAVPTKVSVGVGVRTKLVGTVHWQHRMLAAVRGFGFPISCLQQRFSNRVSQAAGRDKFTRAMVSGTADGGGAASGASAPVTGARSASALVQCDSNSLTCCWGPHCMTKDMVCRPSSSRLQWGPC